MGPTKHIFYHTLQTNPTYKIAL